MRCTGCGKRGWDKTRLHLERGRHSFLWSSDELSKPTCKEFGAQNFKQIEIFLSPSPSVSNCPGDLTESCYTRCDFRWVVSGFNNVFIFIAVIFGCLGTLQSLVALPALSDGSDARTRGIQRWRCQHGASGTHPGPALSSHGSPVRNAWHSHPFKQHHPGLPTPNISHGVQRNWTLGRGRVEVKSSWTCEIHVQMGQLWFKAKQTQLRSTSKAAADGKSLWGGPGVGQEEKPQNFPQPSFFPFLVTPVRAWSYRSMPQWRHGKRERRIFRGQVSCITFFIFNNLFPIKETVHLQLFIGVQIWSQRASCPRQRGGRKKWNGLLVATFHLSKEHLGGHPRRILLCFNKVTMGSKAQSRHPKNRAKKGTRTIRDLFYSCTEDRRDRGRLQEYILEAQCAGILRRASGTEAPHPFHLEYIKYINKF